MNMARAANKYFNDKAPWKADQGRTLPTPHLTVNTCLQAIRTLSIAFAPLLPTCQQGNGGAHVGEPVNTGAPGEGGDDVWHAAAADRRTARRQKADR